MESDKRSPAHATTTVLTSAYLLPIVFNYIAHLRQTDSQPMVHLKIRHRTWAARPP